jgi:hypothetical protein
VVRASGLGGVTYLPPDIAKKFNGDADDLGAINVLWGSQGATRLDLVGNLAWKMLGMYEKAFNDVIARDDFAEISAKTVGI